MPLLLRAFFVLLLVPALWGCGAHKPVVVQAPRPAAATVAASTPLPLDPAVRMDTLANGLVYYVRRNDRPTDRAELRLVVRAGSLQEDDDQRGLAHVVEHMAFNGTRHFEKQRLVDYLEGIGMRFGPDVNAYTSFGETVYQLTVPTDSLEALTTAFQILEDWAHGLTFDSLEVEKERGVVVEEWRLGRGAEARMRDREFPVLLGGSRYPARLPIGTHESLTAFTPTLLRRYYRDWYRPDLMAVVAVGAFDVDHVEGLIREHFAPLAAPAVLRPRLDAPVPDHDAPRVSVVTDPEASGSSVTVFYKQPVAGVGTWADYRRDLVALLYSGLLTDRLQERARRPDAPFLYAYASKGGLVRTKDAFTLSAGVTDGQLVEGLTALLTEAERVARYGFTATELARRKTNLLRLVERSYAERDNARSDGQAAQLVSRYLGGSAVPGPEATYALYRQLLPTITLDEVNRLGTAWLTPRNQVLLARLPRQDSLAAPTPEQLLGVAAAVAAADLAPYEDVVSDAPLLPQPPTPGRIVAETPPDSAGVVTWTLGNGARVLIKPTTFQADEVLFGAQSPGGLSLAPDSLFIPAVTAAAIAQESGVGPFSLEALQKRLTGQAVTVLPWINDDEEGLSGSASPRDLETMLQLVHGYMTAPRADTAAFTAYRDRMMGFFAHREARPESAFADTIKVTMAQYHVRERPWSSAVFSEMALAPSMAFYRDRFGDASDFTFLFVGNVDPDSLRPLVTRYLASLPAAGRAEQPRDVGIRPPEGVVEKTVRRGQEPRARLQLLFTGPMAPDRRSRYALGALAEVLQTKLRETLREDLGGTYGVRVSGAAQRRPVPAYRFSISFAADPARLPELEAAVFAHLDSLRSFPVAPAYLQKVRAAQLRSHETNLEENRYWLAVLEQTTRYDGTPTTVFSYPALVASLDAAMIQDAAQRYLRTDRYVRVSLLPESFNDDLP